MTIVGNIRPMEERVQVPFDYSSSWATYAKSANENVKGK